MRTENWLWVYPCAGYWWHGILGWWCPPKILIYTEPFWGVESLRIHSVTLNWHHTGWGWVLNPKTSILRVRRPCGEDTEPTRGVQGDGGAEIPVCSYQPRIADNHQESGGGEEGFFWRVFRKSTAQLTPWIQTSGHQNWERIDSYCCKPPSLLYFVMETRGPWCTWCLDLGCCNKTA